MIKIALCINRTKERNSILQEITESFEQHNIPHDILVCSDSDDLMDKTRDTFCPDILLFDMHGENGRLRQAALSLKQKNHKLISAAPLTDTVIKNVSRYRVRSLPAAGALLRDEDRGETQMSLID